MSIQAVALAQKITAKAEDVLSGLDREMAIMKWPPKFRAIMWAAVIEAASKRQVDAEMKKAAP